MTIYNSGKSFIGLVRGYDYKTGYSYQMLYSGAYDTTSKTWKVSSNPSLSVPKPAERFAFAQFNNNLYFAYNNSGTSQIGVFSSNADGSLKVTANIKDPFGMGEYITFMKVEPEKKQMVVMMIIQTFVVDLTSNTVIGFINGAPILFGPPVPYKNGSIYSGAATGYYTLDKTFKITKSIPWLHVFDVYNSNDNSVWSLKTPDPVKL
jgi:hypothetical protein